MKTGLVLEGGAQLRNVYPQAFWTPGWVNRYPLMESSVCRPVRCLGSMLPPVRRDAPYGII